MGCRRYGHAAGTQLVAARPARSKAACAAPRPAQQQRALPAACRCGGAAGQQRTVSLCSAASQPATLYPAASTRTAASLALAGGGCCSAGAAFATKQSSVLQSHQICLMVVISEMNQAICAAADLVMVGLQVEQAACRREAAAANRQESEPDPAWHSASPAADAHATAASDGTWYADENHGAEPLSCVRAGTLSHQQWQRGDPVKAGGVKTGHTNGEPTPAAGSLQRQQRLQQLYQELQLLDGEALQPRSCPPCQ
jgi:hypothetical protein